MNYVKFTDFNVYNKSISEYIKLYVKDRKNIGCPIQLSDGNVYYPIYDIDLFPQYFINENCNIYDSLNNIINCYNLNDKIELQSTNMKNINIYEVKDLYSRTFYRYTNGTHIQWKYNIPSKINISYYNEYNHDTYTVYGEEFKRITIPYNTTEYKEFIEKDNAVLLISESGAIINLKNKKILRFYLSSNGTYYIKSKNNYRLNLLKAFLYSDWFKYRYINNKTNINIGLLSPCDGFLSLDKIFTFRNKSFCIMPIESKVFIKDIINAMHDYSTRCNSCKIIKQIRDKKYIKISLSEGTKYFGRFINIPIEGLNNYGITKCGVIYSFKTNQIILPRKMIKEKIGSTTIQDLHYYFPELNQKISLMDLMLWTHFRLTKSDLSYWNMDIQLNNKFNVPIINSLTLISKTVKKNYKEYQIGDTIYKRAYAHPKYYISKKGSIIDVDYNNFYELYGTYTTPTFKLYLSNTKHRIWVDISRMMYRTWVSKDIPNNSSILYKNGIKEDYSAENIILFNGDKK